MGPAGMEKAMFPAGMEACKSLLVLREVPANAHAGSRTRVTSMGGLYDAATLRALVHSNLDHYPSWTFSRSGVQQNKPTFFLYRKQAACVLKFWRCFT